jgi:hypothetical protein
LYFGQRVDRFFGTAWAFPTSNTSTAYIATTISHEAGHNLSLTHDGTSSASYYGGHGDTTTGWGPIMGASSRPYTQWSAGGYFNANNFEDDIGDIGARTGYATDETNALGNAVQLTNQVSSSDAIISSAADVDYYRINAVGGTLSVTVNRSAYGANLHARVAVLNASGVEIASTTAIGSPTVTVNAGNVSAGTYYVAVSASGYLGSSDGFPGYGSLGYYRVTSFNVSAAPINLTVNPTSSQTLTATWAEGVPGAGSTFRVRWCRTANNECPVAYEVTTTSTTFVAPEPIGSWYARVSARSTVTPLSTETISNSSNVLTVPISPTAQRVSLNDDADTLTILWGWR